ncbi:TRAP transporter substrate-binding protein [Metabacillus sp. B2-18]|uniref:TRAP transporter substrate-binding protein n=1 Tax=Metabacillus sp. B2-18 TaxID=2897333 RepID=UPI001E3F297F|nr:DctP family TRAP transporter solute-binding subunit [Metabacillus sp. B2-18]UGB32226.1 DctP family TRAP transporter solute-binding subunit [Metabacillus sp. B2-18]
MRKQSQFKLYIVGFVVLCLGMLAACSSDSTSGESSSGESSSSEETIQLRLSHVVAEDHASNLALLEFEKAIEAKTDGRIDVEIFPNGQLYGSDREAVEAVQLGNIEMTTIATPTLSSFSSKFMVIDLPFIFKSDEAAHNAMDGELGQTLNDELPAINLVGLGYGENGFRHLVNNKRQIETPEDLDGLKMRVMENKLYQDTFNLLGANASPLAFGELYSALQQGTYDAMDNPISLIYASKFYEVQDYLTLSGHVYAPVITVMNKEVLEGMPEDLQTILLEEAKKMSQNQREITHQQDEEMLEKLKEQGMKVNELTDEQKDTFVKNVQPIYEEYVDEIGQDLIDLAKSYNE